jgi:hypothetical protein
MHLNWEEPQNASMSVGRTELTSKRRSGRLFDGQATIQSDPD